MIYNCFGYMELCEKLFTGVPLTDKHMNFAIEELRQYILKADGLKVMNKLGIGIRIVTSRDLSMNEMRSHSSEIIRKRFVYIKGNRVGDELEIHEIKNLGHFLHGGSYEHIEEE